MSTTIPSSINFIHILLIAPLFAYVGYYGRETDHQAFTALMALGILALFYHTYRTYEDFKWINMFHIFIVAPLLIYMGYYGSKSAPRSFTALLVMAPAIFLYHAYRVFVKFR